MHSISDFKIAIIGAGPAGLTLASLLTASSHPFDFTIFELRNRPDPSEVDIPCGNLDLQEEFGLDAIKACGLYPQFQQIQSGCTEQTKVLDKHGKVLFDEMGQGHPEISRNALTQLLLSSVPAQCIRWGTKVLSITPSGGDSSLESKPTVEFQDKKTTLPASETTSSETYDLIVGADGAWSRTRATIPSAPKPIYSGVCYITMYLPRLADRYPELEKLIGGGTFAVCGDHKLVLAQRACHGTARVCLFLHSKCQTAAAAAQKEKLSSSVDHDDTTGPNPLVTADHLLSTLPSNPQSLRKFLLTNEEFFASWSEDIKHLLSVACEVQPADFEVDKEQMHMLPLAPYPHPHMRGIALVGDAAHLMTPFAGMGVNVAMQDSLRLAEALERMMVGGGMSSGTVGDVLDDALVAYEEKVHPEAKKAMDLTWLNLVRSYSEKGPEMLGEVMAT
ncbi:hypothetical protein FE257_010057 [Aspergillus nanangensis]|uniref:FAD-binding domain-containing protein n=1 Tax=Aspergillus nanangensis TaxID=2582783 RepID=A0AAD4CWS1_ASPNN|nr:hypothetical protein FE257_010057 [Aspergillus nanangensis]